MILMSKYMFQMARNQIVMLFLFCSDVRVKNQKWPPNVIKYIKNVPNDN